MLIGQLVHLEHPTGPALPFLVLFVVIVAGPMIIERFRIPGIVGLLLGGLLIGPHVLGLVGSGNTTVPDLGQIGLLYLMFVAGLELDLRLVQAHRRATLVYSALAFTLPMTAGTIVGLLLGYGAAASALLGSLMASHTLVVYPTIRAMGRGDDPAVATGVGATIVTDTLTLIVLAIVSGITVGTSGGFEIGSQIVIGLVAVAGGCFLVLPRLARLFLGNLGKAHASRYLFALISMLAAATLAQAFGIEGIVGAFFAGLALNRLVPNEGDLMERIEFFGGAVFVPVFLVSVGLIINPTVMTDPATLRLAAIFIGACFGGKALAATLTRPLLGFGWPEVGVLFSLTIPQAAATLAATIVGYDIGLFGTEVVNAVLVLILVSLVLSATLTPIFTRRLAESVPQAGRFGKRVLLVLDPHTTLRRGVAELAKQLAGSDDGIVIPVVVAAEDDQPDPSAWGAIGATLVLLGIDRPVEVFVDHTIAAGIRHAARTYRSTSTVLDDPDGALHELIRDSIDQPILFVGSINGVQHSRAAIHRAHEDDPMLIDLAGRLARSTGSLSDDHPYDIVMHPAGNDGPELGSRAVTVVRVLSGATARNESGERMSWRGGELRALLVEGRHFVIGAALVGAVTGFAVAGFERLTVNVVFENLVSSLPLVLLAFAPGVGLAIAALWLWGPGRGLNRATADEYLDAFHKDRQLGFRDMLNKLVAAVATLGSGGALGLEGPSIFMGASLGALAQRKFARFFIGADRNLLLVAGAAAGIAAIFKAPATGAIFAIEVPYQDDLARRMLLPALVAAASGYLALVAVNGTASLFPVAGVPPLSFVDLAGAAGLGLAAALGARVFARMLLWAKYIAERGHTVVRVVAAGGAIAVLFAIGRSLTGESLVLTPGYGVVTWALDPKRSVAILVAVLVLRCLATTATVSGGGVGGLFVPLVVAGALLGRAFGIVVGGDDALFLVIGIAAFLGAGYRVPLAAIMFVAETTGRPGFVVPAVIAAVVAELAMGSSSVTSHQKASNAGFAADSD